MKPIISVENLGKQYRINALRTHYLTLRESVVMAVRNSVGRLTNGDLPKEQTIWALKDINFEVMPGEIVGIIGRNGAGKSTLLKILSRITEPTTGRVDLYGRVGSLLEVGTGFHLELSGRENIYLNGAILGMGRSEIDRKLDDIIAFAEVEKFIDTPVKHYSSGMYLRLAFSVAAHLEPEILVIDEVLAVGDSSFTKKCLGRMGDVAKQGRTVLFVSHSMSAVQNLCHTGIVLAQGKISYHGKVGDAIKQYLAESETEAGPRDLTAVQNRSGAGHIRLVRFCIEDDTGAQVTTVASGESCRLIVEYESVDGHPRQDLFMAIIINTLTGMPVSLINTTLVGQNFATSPPRGRISFEIPRLPLTGGRYVVDLNLATNNGYTPADSIKSAASFDVCDGDFYGSGYAGSRFAPVMIDGKWRLDGISG